MKKSEPLWPFGKTWAITDRKLVGPSFLSRLGQLCEEGLPTLLLREKDLPSSEFSDLAKNVADITKKSRTKLIINIGNKEKASHRLDVALQVNADGVHLPEDSLTVSEVRKRTEKSHRVFVGQSMHPSQTDFQFPHGEEEPDYVLVAPIFPVQKEFGSSSPLGVDVLRSFVQESQVPVVALGGVQDENLESVLQTGVHAVAMRSHFWQSKNR